ncbi:MAG: ABC transporter ATP-binding protein, partial [Actinomycetes bacterium]
SRPLQMTTGLVGLAGSLISIVGIGGALLVIQPLFVLLVVVAYIPVWLATVRASRAVYRWDAAFTERERRRMYLEAILTRKEEAKELRAFDAAQFLRGRYDRLYDERLRELSIVVRRRLRLGVAGSLGTSALTGGALAFLVWLISAHRISLAGAGAAAAAVVLLGAQLQGLAGSAGQLYESSLFIQDFTSFVAWAPHLARAARDGVTPPGPFTHLHADRLTFTYPSQRAPSLDRVSVDVAAGEIVALVGDNGSGKTTLAKLLAGLLRPESGRISWDGTDTADFDPVGMREHITVVFQDFVHYALSLADNIELGRPGATGDTGALERAIAQAGITQLAAQLPDGVHTPLGPEFYGGVDLSGGQWQRVALARAFFRDAPFVILDEPTAALDPRSEAALFDRVRALFAGRAVLLISHRFSSVRNANRIYVLAGGRVTEHGTHAELMAAGGTYAELYRLQAATFLDESAPSP